MSALLRASGERIGDDGCSWCATEIRAGLIKPGWLCSVECRGRVVSARAMVRRGDAPPQPLTAVQAAFLRSEMEAEAARVAAWIEEWT
jgi:hypothetical protein